MSELDNLSAVNSTVYTPSTRRVRAAYISQVIGLTRYEGKAEAIQKDFDRWLSGIRKEERERAIQIFDKATFHYGKTHSGRTICQTCDLFLAIQGENERALKMSVTITATKGP